MDWTCTSCAQANPDAASFCGRCGARRAAAGGDPRIGEVLLGRYRVSAKLGEGAMGAVYRAEQTMGAATRPVAVKVLHAVLMRDPALRSRFERECELVIQLDHPNTIKFYDFGQLPDGSLAIVMEYVSGESLADRIARGPLSVESAMDVVGQVCGSLHEAHARGIVHRDLKPDNILLAERAGRRDFVKVLDFGIAKQHGAGEATGQLTMQGTVLGTPPYMSPEQFAGNDLDARSDVYSLGVMTYEMLTGTLPFPPAANVFEWAQRHLHDPPIPVDQHGVSAQLSPRARATLMRALAKDPAARPTSVLELARELIGLDRLDAGWALVTARGVPPSSPGVAATAALPISAPGVWAPPAHPAGVQAPSSTPRRAAPGSRWARAALVALAASVLGAGTAVAGYVVFFRGDPPPGDGGAAPESAAPEDVPAVATATTPPNGGDGDPANPDDPGGEHVVPVDRATEPPATPLPSEWLRIVHHARAVHEPSAAIGAPDGRFATISPGGVLTLELLPGSQIATDGGPGPDIYVAVDDTSSGAYRVEGGGGHDAFRIIVSDVAGTLPLDLDQYRLRTVRYLRISARSSRPVLVDAVGVYRVRTPGAHHHH